MAVSFGDQISTVLMAQPAGNDLEINPGFNGVAAKIMAKAVMHEVRQSGLLAGGDDGALGIVNGNDLVRRRGSGFAVDEFEQFTHGRE